MGWPVMSADAGEVVRVAGPLYPRDLFPVTAPPALEPAVNDVHHRAA